MTAVLKHATTTTRDVRSFGAAPPPPAADPVAPLLAEIERLASALDTAQTDAATAIARARSDGRAEGRAQAESGEADRLEALRDGLSDHAAALAERLEALEGLAVALAKAALAKVFDRPDDMAEMVAATLARHVAALKERAVLAVTVSGADFADPAPLDALLPASEGRRAEIAIDPDLPAGACRVRHTLGGIDLDVPGQWSGLAALLDGAAA